MAVVYGEASEWVGRPSANILGEGERRTWDVCFTWNLNDWELDLVVDLFHILESNTPSMDNEDCMKWKLKKDGDFDIRSLYYELMLMGDNLRLKGFDFVDWCIMCCHCGETVDHLLLHIEKAHRLWSFVFTFFGILWVIPRAIPDLLFGWWNWLGKHSSNI
ncbi:hypothetical protein SO802_002348 [Lithocarpus litseifolius]|uniref:C2H2-type domain-containing protein n=1 Tax=Lithocarpus litseifolius TaxID=425828 RepID=A0AAW2E0R8_9ROSI